MRRPTCSESVIRLTQRQRNFKFVTMLGFASTVIVSWEVLLPYAGVLLIGCKLVTDHIQRLHFCAHQWWYRHPFLGLRYGVYRHVARVCQSC